MTADCHFDTWEVQTGWGFMQFTSGTFTINGNGHSIIGPSNGYAIIVGLNNAVTSTVLNLNDVTIRNAGQSNANVQSVIVQRGAQLNGRNIIFRNNHGAAAIMANWEGKIYLENVQFLSNRKTYGAAVNQGSAVAAVPGASTTPANTVIEITNAIFDSNTAASSPVVLSNVGSTLTLNGCIVDRSNEGTFIHTATGATTNDNRDDAACLALTPSPTPPPKKKKEAKGPTAMPTSTPRPQIAATHVALQAATGATFRTTFGLDSGVHFRQLDGAGIGIQSIIDAGYLEAFDVWGYVEQGVEVCFPQVGRVIFLDANTSPRAIVSLESTVVNGKTCVSISSPGSLVLLPN